MRSRNQQGNMKTFAQKVGHETIPAYCFYCKMEGHTNDSCRIANPQTQGVVNGEEIYNNNNRPETQEGRENNRQHHQGKYFNSQYPNKENGHKSNKAVNTKTTRINPGKNNYNVEGGWHNVDRRNNRGKTPAKNHQEIGNRNNFQALEETQGEQQSKQQPIRQINNSKANMEVLQNANVQTQEQRITPTREMI